MQDFFGNAVLLTAVSVGTAYLFTRLFTYFSSKA